MITGLSHSLDFSAKGKKIQKKILIILDKLPGVLSSHWKYYKINVEYITLGKYISLIRIMMEKKTSEYHCDLVNMCYWQSYSSVAHELVYIQ